MSGTVIQQPESNLVLRNVENNFEESSYLSAVSLLLSYLSGESQLSKHTIPPPHHLRLLVTMLVHPSTTNTSLRAEASHLLSAILDVADPAELKLDQIWTFTHGKRKRQEDSDDDHYMELEDESLFSNSDDIWHVIEWSFFKAEGGWLELLGFILRVLQNDFVARRRKIQELEKDEELDVKEKEAKRKELLDGIILAMWLRNRHGEADIKTAFRSIFASRGEEMMEDRPRHGIYEDASSVEERVSETEDLWDGPLLLQYRVDLLNMMFLIAREYPDQKFLDEFRFLETLSKRLRDKLDSTSVSQFLKSLGSKSFRLALCEMLAQDLSPEAFRTVSKSTGDLVITLPRAYLPSLPKNADDLGMYCVVVGFLLRTWLLFNLGENGEMQGCPGLAAAVDKANLRRRQKLISIKGVKVMEVRSIIDAEERIMNVIVKRMEAETGVV